MKENTVLQRLEDDYSSGGLPDAVDADRLSLSRTLDPSSRKKLGQFMTPAAVAKFMASMFAHGRRSVRLLDAGAGMGSLLAAYVDAMCDASHPTERSVEVTAIEIDPLLADRLRSTLKACGARCSETGLAFESEVVEQDFIEYAVELATLDGMFDEQRLAHFDAAILNPPYTKINIDSLHRRLLRHIGIESTNLYSAFVAIAIKMLRPGGELVAITPRSFCNGPYFRHFRQTLVSRMSLRSVHVYESRKDAFRDDEVLQENVILYAVKDERPPVTVRVTTSTSSRHADLVGRDVPCAHVVRPHDPDAFIHITTSDEDGGPAELVLRQPCNLASLGLGVSTGRVVDFRAREHLRKEPDSTTVPLIYPAHFENGFVTWPRNGGRKPNAIYSGPETSELMVPKGTYVLTKRFTSKEERRRVVACIYDPRRVRESFPVVGFENHLNYFHANGKGIRPKLARGLAVYLNSTAVDRYFRQFSGHTQVNATDLRSLKYPDDQTLETIGHAVGDRIVDQVAVDAVIEATLRLKLSTENCFEGSS